MDGFFSKKEVTSVTRPDGKVYSCVSCGRSTNCTSPNIKVAGEGKEKFLIVLPYPGKTEDTKGEPCGVQYKHLQKMLKHHRIDIVRDCWVTYAVKCAGGEPTGDQINCCRKNIMSFIDKNKPKVTLFFGNVGLQAIIGHRWKKGLDTIDKWQGFSIPDQELGTWLVPCYSLLMLEGKNSEPYENIIRKTLEKAVRCLKKEFPIYKHPEVIYLDNLDELRKIKGGITAFDYEATGIKPHGVGHKLVCASIAVSADKVYTFLIPKSTKERQPFIDYLQNENILKMAHNMKYEDTWSRVRLRTEVKGWLWDSMVAAHIIDNRPNIVGLKFQSYVNFGIIDYDSEISPYLTSNEKDGNSLNTVEKCLESPELTKKLLLYCAMDSALEYKLAMEQRHYMAGTQGRTEISPKHSNFIAAYQLFHQTTLAFSKAENHGLRIDVDYIDKTQAHLTRKVVRAERKIKDSQFYKDWQRASKSPINLNSGTALANYLYNVKGITPKKFTDKGTGSTDEEALRLLKIPECDMLIERTKFMKLRDTFLEGFKREQAKGVLHPAFNLHLVRTYRSSSSNPNFQNIPKRDKFAFSTCRSAIFPRKGNQLLEVDFSGMEVSIAACYHKDLNMIAYLNDPTKDMHGDMAAQIFCIKAFDKHKESHSTLRKASKNAFVFPQFYGDYYKNNAEGLCGWVQLPQTTWKSTDGILLEDGLRIGEHMIKAGIKSFDAFVEHMKKIEDHFWNVRFKHYGKWKEGQWEFYLENGYIPFKTGFVVQGIMNRKEVTNYPIQGAAFHCLCWAFNRITEELEKRGYGSRLVGQIHDAMVFDIVPSELEEVYKLVEHIATVEITKAWKWINVPLKVEAELCAVDAPWSSKQEFEF